MDASGGSDTHLLRCLLEKRKVHLPDFPKLNFLLFKYLGLQEVMFQMLKFKLFNIRSAARRAKTCCD